jgi:hypothetical protein
VGSQIQNTHILNKFSLCIAFLFFRAKKYKKFFLGVIISSKSVTMGVKKILNFGLISYLKEYLRFGAPEKS